MSEHLIFQVSDQHYAIPYLNIDRVIDTPSSTSIPKTNSFMRGVISDMGWAIPQYDFRKRIGIKSFFEEMEELIESLKHRKQDHLNWLANLKKSVGENREITVETNHHKCAFGKWYDNFKHESINLTHYFHQFDKPHKAVHQIAINAKKYLAQGNVKAAQQLIKETEEGVLSRLIKLFDGAEEAIRKFSYEYSIILTDASDNKFAIVVDTVKDFKKLDGNLQNIPEKEKSEITFIDKIYMEDENSILVVDIDKFRS